MSILELVPDCFFAPHTEGLRPIAFYGFLHFLKEQSGFQFTTELWFMFNDMVYVLLVLFVKCGLD